MSERPTGDYAEFVLQETDYEVVKRLGPGLGAKEMQIVRRRADGRAEYFRRVFGADMNQKVLFGEIDILFLMRPHPAITKFIGFTIGGEGRAIYTEYVPGTSLKEVFDDVAAGRAPDWWDATVKAKVIYGLAAALMHIHAHEVFHRDVKPSNVLLDENHEVRLANFMYGTRPAEAGQTLIPAQPSARFMAPELQDPRTVADERALAKADIFAFGMIAAEIVTKRHFEPGKSDDDVVWAIRNGNRPVLPMDTPDVVGSIIEACLKQDPEDRPMAYHIVYHIEHMTEALFPGADMERFADYRQRIYQATLQSCTAATLFSSPPDDDEDEFRRMQDKADGGDVHAMLTVGRYLQKGQNVAPDPEAAIRYFQMAADRDSAQGKFHLAMAKRRRRGCPLDQRGAAELMRQASDQGYSYAMIEWAIMLERGEGVAAPNPREAAKVMKACAERNIGEAQQRFGLMCEQGIGVPKNLSEAARWYRLGHENGEPAATNDLARLLICGLGVDQDIDQGLRIWGQAAARKVPAALLNLGIIYFDEIIRDQYKIRIPIDKRKALDYFLQATRCNCPEAFYWAGKTYRSISQELRAAGNAEEADENLRKARDMLGQAAEARPQEDEGSWRRNSQFFYGMMCLNGDGGVANMFAACANLLAAAKAGHKAATLKLAELKDPMVAPEDFPGDRVSKKEMLDLLAHFKDADPKAATLYDKLRK